MAGDNRRAVVAALESIEKLFELEEYAPRKGPHSYPQDIQLIRRELEALWAGEIQNDEPVHDQVRKLLTRAFDTTGVKVQSIAVNWADSMAYSQISGIEIVSGKR